MDTASMGFIVERGANDACRKSVMDIGEPIVGGPCTGAAARCNCTRSSLVYRIVECTQTTIAKMPLLNCLNLGAVR